MEKNQSLDRTLDILESFTVGRPCLGLSELARTVDLPKATVYRIAETLVARGYLIKEMKDQSYQLGYKVLNLSNVMLSHLDYRQIALPHMRQIRDETNESVTLYIALNAKQRLCVERVQSTNGLSRIVNVGMFFRSNAVRQVKSFWPFRIRPCCRPIARYRSLNWKRYAVWVMRSAMRKEKRGYRLWRRRFSTNMARLWRLCRFPDRHSGMNRRIWNGSFS